MSDDNPKPYDPNPWNTLSQMFGGHISDDVISPEAADNILIAWPVILQELEAAVPTPARVLDFGCGGGRFVAELLNRGYDATGIDSSEAMIESALQVVSDTDRFLCGDSATVAELSPFDVVTSIMVMQFVAEPVGVFARITSGLKPDGHVMIAVHNPPYVEAWITRGSSKFVLNDTDEWSRKGTLQLSGATIPIFIRDAAAYADIASKAGLVPTFRHEPAFTPEFIQRFDWQGPTEVSEFLLLGFVKR